MPTQSRTTMDQTPEQVSHSAEGNQPGERGPIVIEYTGQARELLDVCLDEAQRRLVAGGVLYLTVPYWLDGEPVVAALRARFSFSAPDYTGIKVSLRRLETRSWVGSVSH